MTDCIENNHEAKAAMNHTTNYWLPEKDSEIVIPYWAILLVLAVLVLLALWFVKRRKP